eukprot:Gregarina_sp_Pseudo_9__959@NODE_1614_length_1451_cov_146_936261_g1497_i0_p2_GENE_NODE_1614_length_1451_cov_146_936261_g1497_i0NODE_1614_length_1451_cov_146_936261_g1497_i0_p2_ORF_typecomplete_len145_score30_93AHSA1/PF08327_11/1_2e11_NODE_1614_length_1451_cov_146_936261_g1497_i09401374
MTLVESSIIFNVPPHVIYQSLATEEGLTRLALGRPTKFVAEEGSHFSLLGGEFVGKVEALKPNQEIQLSFKRQGWSQSSKVHIELTPYNGKSDRTLVHLTHSSIPVPANATELAAQQEVKALWEKQFWDILDKVFGYGRDNIED